MIETEKPTKKESQVDEQGHFLQASIDQLAETIEALEMRLDRVLLPSQMAAEKEGVEANLVPLADFLRTRAWAIHGLRNRVTGILERLEL